MILLLLKIKRMLPRPRSFLSPGGGGGGRTPHMKGVGMLVGKFWIKPLKETDLGVAQAFVDP